MSLNNLTKKAWIKLSKTFWSTQRAIQHLEIQPLAIESFYLGKIKPSTFSTTDASRVKLIELLTRKSQLVLGDEVTKKAALEMNRQFDFLDDLNESKIQADLIIRQIKHHEENFIEHLSRDYEKLKPQSYAALMVSDYRDKTGYCLFHAVVAESLQKIGFSIQGLMILVKEQQTLKPYGYPKTFVPNIINQFVIVARKIL